MKIEPLSWKDRPSLIESLLPTQKISAEAQKERKAGAGQTLTALGSYWKGRKPLILAKACVLGALLPATDDPEADLTIFEKLMAIDDEAFLRREFRGAACDVYEVLTREGRLTKDEARRLFKVQIREVTTSVKGKRKTTYRFEDFNPADMETIHNNRDQSLAWSRDLTEEEYFLWQAEYVRCHDYLSRVAAAKRPEELDQQRLFAPVWEDVNAHLGTSAQSMPQLMEQLGILRFGHRPKVGDTFCGSGQIPFEAARLGCDVYASDLNPIACMLTWGAFNIIGADETTRREIERAQREVAKAVDREITALGIEHDSHGNRAKAYLYCLEIRCRETGWLVPMAPSWVISKTRNVIARLIPDPIQKRFIIDILTGVSEAEMTEAAKGTVQDGELVYTLDGEEYRTPIKTIRGDYRLPDGTSGNKLRRWELHDFKPRPDDIFQERLYCIQWITEKSLTKGRQETFFAAVTEEDLEREAKVEAIVAENLARWQKEGLVPDMPIEPGAKTDEPIRTRGWTYWHHLFPPRHIILACLILRSCLAESYAGAAITRYIATWNHMTKLCRLNTFPGPGRLPKLAEVFDNQALNTQYNYGIRSLVSG